MFSEGESCSWLSAGHLCNCQLRAFILLYTAKAQRKTKLVQDHASIPFPLTR